MLILQALYLCNPNLNCAQRRANRGRPHHTRAIADMHFNHRTHQMPYSSSISLMDPPTQPSLHPNFLQPRHHLQRDPHQMDRTRHSHLPHPIPRLPDSSRFLPFSKTLPPIAQCNDKRKPLQVHSKPDEHSHTGPRLLRSQPLNHQQISLPSPPRPVHEPMALPGSAPSLSNQSQRMPDSQHNHCGQEELAAASALNKMASAGGLHSSPPQSSISDRIDKLEEDFRVFSKDVRTDLASLREMMVQHIDMTRQLLVSNKGVDANHDASPGRRRHTTTHSSLKDGRVQNQEINVEAGNTNDMQRRQRSGERGTTRSGLSSRHSSSVSPAAHLKQVGAECQKTSIHGKGKGELTGCLEVRRGERQNVEQKRVGPTELAGGEMSSVGGSTSCSDRPRQRQKPECVGEDVVARAGIRKKRVRDNWTPQEDEVFFALVMEMRGMAEQSVLRKLADRLGPRRTYHQCKGHLKNMRAAGKLPG